MKNIQVELKGAFVGDLPPSMPVLSRHRGVINLQNRATGFLISLVEEKSAMTGMSLLVPSLQENCQLLPEPGKTVRLVSPGRMAAGGLRIDYGCAAAWRGTPPSGTADLPRRRIELEILKVCLNEKESFLSLLTGRSRTVFQLKAREILNSRVKLEKGTISGLDQLSGLGPGLTPSGDDFIAGALLAEACRSRSMKEPGVPGIDRQEIRCCLEGTTTAGRTLLHLALEGSFPAYLLTFLKEAGESERREDFLAAAEKASRHGSTSGRDALAGFYWYYDFIRTPFFHTAAGFRAP